MHVNTLKAALLPGGDPMGPRPAVHEFAWQIRSTGFGVLWGVFFLDLFIYVCIYFRESVRTSIWGSGGSPERGRESEADSAVSTEPDVGPHPTSGRP